MLNSKISSAVLTLNDSDGIERDGFDFCEYLDEYPNELALAQAACDYIGDAAASSGQPEYTRGHLTITYIGGYSISIPMQHLNSVYTKPQNIPKISFSA